nr:MAG TPA: hypothetical protein [Caudoviricetes sp.]
MTNKKRDLLRKVYKMALFWQCHFVIKKLKRERCGGWKNETLD